MPGGVHHSHGIGGSAKTAVGGVDAVGGKHIGLFALKLGMGQRQKGLHVGGGAGSQQRIGRLIRPKVAHDELGPMVLNLLRAWAEEDPEASFHDFAARHDEGALRAIAEAPHPESVA